MIAKIGRGSNLYGALVYNQLKVEFEPYLLANRKTEKPILHISLNPDPKDKVSDEQFEKLAQEYMQKMGYAEQPFVIFKHTDLDRTHIHIVSVCVDEEGRKISDKFEKRRSMDVCRELEKQFCLISAIEKKQNPQNQIFNPVDYKAGDIKSQLASVIRHLPKYYKFEGFGAYNALLSLFNITAEEVKGEINGISKQGLVYFAINEKGEKASNPFKASLFGKQAGYVQLQQHYAQSKELLKNEPSKALLKTTIEMCLQMASDEKEFKKRLLERGINTVVRRNTEGRVYGITFVDHRAKSVWNGSQLGKNLSANVFNDWWNNGNKMEQPVKGNGASSNNATINEDIKQTHMLFDFLVKENMSYSHEENNLIEVFGGLLSNGKAVNYDEELFVNQIKKKARRKKR